jgi:protein required for attachment to host cells
MDHWIVIADAGTARIFRSDEALVAWTGVRTLSNDRIHLHAADLASDHRGATRARPGGDRSALDRHTDPHDVERVRFAGAVADAIDEGLASGAYERLVIAAAPKFLGDLREKLSDRVARRLAASIPHDFTHTTVDDLPDAVRGHLPADAGRALD